MHGHISNWTVGYLIFQLAIGSANALSAFVMSYPVTGSFSRTAVNSQSNVATPAGGLVCGTLVLLAALFLTPIFVYIPSGTFDQILYSLSSDNS